ncbi:hypothetical protein ACFWIB_39310 [Streptomyces sp. NPDC127051]|uniref:hypothetical protein n=1 Tax=Streptomyces sp. NPDC127051 TaxID=3347119 RepID=UPI00364C97C9
MSGTAWTGKKVNMHPRLFCDPTPSRQSVPDMSGCHLTPNVTFYIDALSDSFFINVVGSSFPLKQQSQNPLNNNKIVGVCTVNSESSITCTPNGNYDMGAGDAVYTDSAVVGQAARTDCVPAFQMYWRDTAGEPQRGEGNPAKFNGQNDLAGENDYLTIKTGGACT